MAEKNVQNRTWQIDTIDELKAFRDEVNAGTSRDEVNAGTSFAGWTVTLGEDIDLEGVEWAPIGNATNNFKGTFDGNDKKISNLVVDTEGGAYAGFFGFLDAAVVKNLTFENVNITGGNYTGTVAGYTNAEYGTCQISGVTVTGTVNVTGGAAVGGIIGGGDAALNNVTVNAAEGSLITGKSGDVGGIAGIVKNDGKTYEEGSQFSGISSNISVKGEGNGVNSVGGVFGVVEEGITIEGVTCSAGSVTADGVGEDSKDSVGGIAGIYGADVTFNDADITVGAVTGSYFDNNGDGHDNNASVGDNYFVGTGEGIVTVNALSVLTVDETGARLANIDLNAAGLVIAESADLSIGENASVIFETSQINGTFNAEGVKTVDLGKITLNGTLNLDAESYVKGTTIELGENGVINLDASDFQGGLKKVLDFNPDSDESLDLNGKINITGLSEDASVFYEADGDVVLSDGNSSAICLTTDAEEKANGDVLEADGKKFYVGFNAFADAGEAASAIAFYRNVNTLYIKGEYTHDSFFTAPVRDFAFLAQEEGDAASLTIYGATYATGSYCNLISGNFTVGAGVTLDIAPDRTTQNFAAFGGADAENSSVWTIDGTFIYGGGDFANVEINVSETGKFLSYGSDNTSFNSNVTLNVTGTGTAEEKMADVQFRGGNWTGFNGCVVNFTGTNVEIEGVNSNNNGGATFNGEGLATITNSVVSMYIDADADEKVYGVLAFDKEMVITDSDIYAGDLNVLNDNIRIAGGSLNLVAGSGFAGDFRYVSTGALKIAEGAALDIAGVEINAADAVVNNGRIDIVGDTDGVNAEIKGGIIAIQNGAVFTSAADVDAKLIYVGYDYAAAADSADSALVVAAGTTVKGADAIYVRTGSTMTIDGTASAGEFYLKGDTTVTDDGIMYVAGTQGIRVKEDAQLTVKGDVIWDLNLSEINNAGLKIEQGSVTVDGGKLSESEASAAGTAEIIISEGSSLSVLNGGRVNLDSVTNAGTIYLDETARITAETLESTGSIIVNAEGFDGINKIIDLNGTTSLEGLVEFENRAEGVNVYYGADGDVTLSNIAVDTFYVDSSFEGEFTDPVAEGKYYGINAFGSFTEALKTVGGATSKIVIADGTVEEFPDENISVALSQDLTISGGKFTWNDDSAALFYVSFVKAADVEGEVTVNFSDLAFDSVSPTEGKKNYVTFEFGALDNADTAVKAVVDADTTLNLSSFVVREGSSLEVEAGGRIIAHTEVARIEGTLSVKGEDGFTIDGATADAAQYTKYLRAFGTGSVEIANNYLGVYDYIQLNSGSTFTADNSLITIGADAAGVWHYNPVSNGFGKLDVKAGSEFTLENGSVLKASANIVNAGVINVSGSTLLADGALVSGDVIKAAQNKGVFTNNGTVELSGESKAVIRELTGEGAFNVSGTAELDIANLASGTVTVKDGATLKDSSVAGDGTVSFAADSTVTFEGANAITAAIDGSVENFDLVVSEGASLLISRYTLAYGRDITVNGTIEDAKQLTPEDVAGMTASLKASSSSGFSLNGWGTSVLTVNDAYIDLGNTSLKAGATGTFTWDFNNAYIKAASFLNGNAAGEGGSLDVTFTGSVLDANYLKNGAGVTVSFTEGSYAGVNSLGINGVLNIDETSEVKVAAYQNNSKGAQDEHGDITGSLNVAGLLDINATGYVADVELWGAKADVSGTLQLNKHNLVLDADSELTVSGTVTTTGTVTNGGTINVSGGSFSAGAVDNGAGVIGVSGESQLNIASFDGNAIVAADGATLTDSTIKGAETYQGVERSGYKYLLSVNGDEAGTLNLAGSNTITSIDAGAGDTVNVTGTLSFGSNGSDGFKLGNGATWNIENAEIKDVWALSLDGAYMTGEENAPVSTMTFTDSTLTADQISAKGVKEGQEIGYGTFNVEFKNSTVALTGKVQTQAQDTADVNISFSEGTSVTAKDLLNDSARGTITFDGTDEVNFSRVFRNKGTVEILNGAEVIANNTYDTTEHYSANEGTINVNGAALNLTGAFTFANSGTIALENASLSAGAVDTAEGTFTVAGEDNTLNIGTLAGTLQAKDGATLTDSTVGGTGTVQALGNLTFAGDNSINALKAVNGGTITVEEGKTLALGNFSFGSKDTAGAEYVIDGGTITADYGFFQHGVYTLNADFETGYMYYSYGSAITVNGNFHSQGASDGLDYVRGKLTVAENGSITHDKALWVGQPASWGEMAASLTVEGIVSVGGTLAVYGGSTMTVNGSGTVSAGAFELTGTLTINAGEEFDGIRKVVDVTGATPSEYDTGLITLNGDVKLAIAEDGDIFIHNADMTTFYVDATYSGAFGDEVADDQYLGINAFNSFAAALDSKTEETATFVVNTDTDSALSGKTITGSIVTENADGVTIDDSLNNNYVNVTGVTVGENVTLDAKYFYLYGSNTINGDVKSSTTFYSSGKLILNGKADLYTTMSRNYAAAEDGIYVVGTAAAGEGAETEAQYVSHNYLGHYSGTFSVKNTAAEFGYILLNGSNDGDIQARLVLDNARVSTIGGPNTQPGQVQMNDDAAIIATNNSLLDFVGPKDFAYLSMGENNSISLTDSEMRLGKEGQGTNTINGTITMASSTLSSLGTIKVGATGSITTSDSDAEDGINKVTAVKINNEGTITAGGWTTLNIGTLEGNAIEIADGAVIDNSTVGGSVSVEGAVTFTGDNTFENIADFGTAYTPNQKWSVAAGGSVTLTGKDKYGFGYGDNVTINGELENAREAYVAGLSADSADFSARGGVIAMTNSGYAGTTSYFTAENAYIRIGMDDLDMSFSNRVKADGASGTYIYSFSNSVLEVNSFNFQETEGLGNGNYHFTFTDSVLVAGPLNTNDKDSSFTFDNTDVTASSASTNGGDLSFVNGTNAVYENVLTNNGSLTIDAASTLTAVGIAGEGTITIDATNFEGGLKKIIDLSGTTSIKSMVKEVTNLGENSIIYGADGDVYLTDATCETIYVSSGYTGSFGDVTEDGKIIGFNAFSSVNDAVKAVGAETSLITVAEGEEAVLSTSVIADHELHVNMGQNGVYVDMNGALVDAEGNAIEDTKAYNWIQVQSAVTIGENVTVTGDLIFAAGGSLIIDGVVNVNGMIGQLSSITINGTLNAGDNLLMLSCAGSDVTVNGTLIAGSLVNYDTTYGGDLTVAAKGSVTVTDLVYTGSRSVAVEGTLTANGYVTVDTLDIAGEGVMNVVYGNDVTIGTLTGTGTVMIDLTGYKGGTDRLIDFTGDIDRFEGKIDVTAPEGTTIVTGADGDIYITDEKRDTLYVNPVTYNGEFGTVVDGLFVGFNAFATLDKAVAVAKADSSISRIEVNVTPEQAKNTFLVSSVDTVQALTIDMGGSGASFNAAGNLTLPGGNWASKIQIKGTTFGENVTIEADTLEVQGGACKFQGAMTVNGAKVTGGSIDLTGALTVNDRMVITAGNVKLQVGEDAVFSAKKINTTAGVEGVSVAIDGTATVHGSFELAGAVTIGAAGTLEVTGGSISSIENANILTVKGGELTNGAFTNYNSGAVSVGEEGALTSDKFINMGSIVVNGGTFEAEELQMVYGTWSFEGLTEGVEDREIEVSIVPAGSDEEEGVSFNVTLKAGETTLSGIVTDHVSGSYTVTIADKTKLYSARQDMTVHGGTLDVTDRAELNIDKVIGGHVALNDNGVLSGKVVGAVGVYGTTGAIKDADVALLSVGYGVENYAEENVTVSVTGKNTISALYVDNGSTFNAGIADGERTELDSASGSIAEDSALNLVNTDMVVSSFTFNGKVTLDNSVIVGTTLTVSSELNLTLDSESVIKFETLNVAALNVTLADSGIGIFKVLDYTLAASDFDSSIYNNVTVVNDGYTLEVIDNDLYAVSDAFDAVDLAMSTSWSGAGTGDTVAPGRIYGTNAYSSFDELPAEVKKLSIVKSEGNVGAYTFTWPCVELFVVDSDITAELTMTGAEVNIAEGSTLGGSITAVDGIHIYGAGTVGNVSGSGRLDGEGITAGAIKGFQSIYTDDLTADAITLSDGSDTLNVKHALTVEGAIDFGKGRIDEMVLAENATVTAGVINTVGAMSVTIDLGGAYDGTAAITVTENGIFESADLVLNLDLVNATLGDTNVLVSGITAFEGTLVYGNADYALDDTLKFSGKNYTITLEDNALVLKGGEVSANVRNDIDGNGYSDIIMMHAAGFSGAWLTQNDGERIKWGNLADKTENSIELLGVGKYDADTAAVYYKDENNHVGIWKLEGEKPVYEGFNTYNANTEVIGLGDFNGDGTTDVLLQDKVHGVVGADIAKEGWTAYEALGSNWEISAIGDFNGDGYDDVVIHDLKDGNSGIWLMNPTGSKDFATWGNLDVLPEETRIVGAGDFNGDGVDDVLLSDGKMIGTWIMNDKGNMDHFQTITHKFSGTIEGTGDFNGDGIDDIQIRVGNESIGYLAISVDGSATWVQLGQDGLGAEWTTKFSAIC